MFCTVGHFVRTYDVGANIWVCTICKWKMLTNIGGCVFSLEIVSNAIRGTRSFGLFAAVYNYEDLPQVWTAVSLSQSACSVSSSPKNSGGKRGPLKNYATDAEA